MSLAACGLAISGYLSAIAIRSAQLPVGCAPGGGCAAVLGSRWAGTWGVSVAIPATLCWGIALVAAWRGNRAILAASGALVGLAALWFVGLQVVALGAYCPWCMADHAIGLCFALLALQIGAARGAGVAFGTVGLAALIAGQLLVPYRPGTLGTLAGATSEGGLTVKVADTAFHPDQEPTWGASDAKETLLLFADYACPHCRATHGYLEELLAADPTRFRVIVAPVPMDHDCNPTLAATEPRFEHSCELVHLAYAVWHADRAAFPAFDHWLFEPESPRSPADATAEAERAVGAERLAEAMKSIDLAPRAIRNIGAFEAIKAKRLPVLVRTRGRSMEGEPSSREELDAFLRGGAADDGTEPVTEAPR